MAWLKERFLIEPNWIVGTMKLSVSILSLWMLLAGSIHVYGQVSISGTVVDREGNDPVYGARIVLDSGTGALSGPTGEFKLNLPAGKYQATISHLGYESREVEIDTERPSMGVIELVMHSTTMDVVVVSASPNSYKSNFKGSNFRINPIVLKNINPLSTEEVLRTIPGVNIVGDMGLSNRPNISIRGSWGRRSKKVLLMEDGSPSAPAPYLAPGAYYNPVSDRVTSVEVYKGADMLRFGPNNMFGAVNYITALPPGKPELRVKLIGGQRNYATGLISYGGTWKNLGALVEGVYKRFDGFVENSSVEVLNLNAKIFAKLSERQSLYFKFSGQFEDNQASLSSQTPYTYSVDPTQNPFDADQFTMRRYGVDIIHRALPAPKISLTTKVYASDFERDWWRQTTAKVKASAVRNYVGEAAFMDRYSYLQGRTFGEEDYLIVGRVVNGRESSTDSRWTYTVSGLQENLNIDWNAFGEKHHLEASVKLHQETYKDISLATDSSRWARTGRTVSDLRYYLWSASGFIRNEFRFRKWGLTPIVRFEHVDMYRQDLLANAQNPGLAGLEDGRETNVYNVVLPGITVDRKLGRGEIFGSIYRGFIAPSKIFGFLVEQNGVVVNPFAGQSINIKPELSVNTEIGLRGGILKDRINGQFAWFNNRIWNFYAGGRNEVFQELGTINIQGGEIALRAKLFQHKSHEMHFTGSGTLLSSRMISGKLADNDLFSQVIHSTATRNEYLQKVNRNREAYEVYAADGNGNDSLLTNPVLTESDFENITRSLVRFGEGGIKNAQAPYSPAVNFSLGLNYKWKTVSMGVSGNYVGKQFTEFYNFSEESADGSIGELPAWFTVDAYLNWDFSVGRKARFNAFVNGKNITNQIYRASRLNRATSGVFPGGFRQIILGLSMQI
jgi:Fe(3+) dicitrate transport protein